MNIQTIIDKFKIEIFVKDGTIPTETYVKVEQFLKDSLTSMLDGIEKELPKEEEKATAKDGDISWGAELRKESRNQYRQEVINIINSHR